MPTVSRRGKTLLDTQSSILHLWVMYPTARHPFRASVQVLCPGRSHFEIVSFPSQHFEGAEAANSSQIRDRSPMVRRMSNRTIHQRRSGTRVRHVQFPFRRGVPPSQRQPQRDTEIPAWGSTCCAHDTHKLSSDENVEEVTEPFIAR